jgi:hypothetical protein
MAGPVPAIHVFAPRKKDVDARIRDAFAGMTVRRIRGHDGCLTRSGVAR